MSARLAALCAVALAMTIGGAAGYAPAAHAFEHSALWQSPDPFAGSAPDSLPFGSAEETFFDGTIPDGQHPVKQWEYAPDQGGWVPMRGGLGPDVTYRGGGQFYTGPLALFNPLAWDKNAENEFYATVWEGMARSFWGFGAGGWQEDAGVSQNTDVLDQEIDGVAQSGSTASTGGGGGGGGGSGYVCVTYNQQGACTQFGFFP